MNEQMNKTKMLEKIQVERELLKTTLAQMSEEQITETPVQTKWTVKDILAHITAWERQLLNWLRTAAQGEPPEIMPEGYDTWDDFDRLNEQIYIENRDRSLADIRADFDRIYQQLLAELQALPDDPHDDQWSVWRDGKPPWALIAGNTYDHYREHLKPIQAWLSKRTQGSNKHGTA